MKSFATLALSLFVSLYSNFASAHDLFDKFSGEYRIASRWCKAGDLPCENLVKIQVGYDTKEMESFLLETYKDGTTNLFLLWEGASGNEQAYITGDFGLSATWSHLGKQEGLGDIIEGASLHRRNPGAPLFYTFDYKTTFGDPTKNVSRRFKLAK